MIEVLEPKYIAALGVLYEVFTRTQPVAYRKETGVLALAPLDAEIVLKFPALFRPLDVYVHKVDDWYPFVQLKDVAVSDLLGGLCLFDALSAIINLDDISDLKFVDDVYLVDFHPGEVAITRSSLAFTNFDDFTLKLTQKFLDLYPGLTFRTPLLTSIAEEEESTEVQSPDAPAEGRKPAEAPDRAEASRRSSFLDFIGSFCCFRRRP